jgi:hypothetical protein
MARSDEGGIARFVDRRFREIAPPGAFAHIGRKRGGTRCV